jgi:hypothetical protein
MFGRRKGTLGATGWTGVLSRLVLDGSKEPEFDGERIKLVTCMSMSLAAE